MSKRLSFEFNGYEPNLTKGEVLFHFGVKGDKNIDFTERISFPPVDSDIPLALFKSLLDNLMLILGISYWKLYCPKDIVIEDNFLTREQAEFWNVAYAKGLGEFFYKNKIDFRGLVSFPFVEKVQNPVSFLRKDRVLLGLGGGKDSIVVAEMLKKESKEFDVHMLDTKIQKDVAKAMNKKPIITKREIDPKLLELNHEKGAYNGHVPVSVIYALLGTMCAAFYDYNSVVVGNEKSANYGNVTYLGEMINHQWSKSEEFEKLFNDYLGKFITPDIKYSSPLRDMSELEVVREFVNYPKYFSVFSSCNNNFKILKQVQDDTGGKWCGKCPKCLFVFTCLAAFLSKEKVLGIFGKNLFEDESLIPLFEELIGVKNFKPFECVGTPEEVKEALGKIEEKKEFNDSVLMKHFKDL
ncbi:MAG: hypothetical protein Q8P26_02465 [Candidatus Levybacteria bacterium]|nr:hypothetical protein [Candidatus Levybacteria bacterium]